MLMVNEVILNRSSGRFPIIQAIFSYESNNKHSWFSLLLTC